VSVVTLYGRPGCHLCDEAREILVGLVAENPEAELREVDIEGDDRLLATYLERIPVVEIDGEIVSELELEPESVASRFILSAPNAGQNEGDADLRSANQ
jgi:glutaredoxin